MSSFNYKKICSDLLSDLNKRQKNIIVRRFALGQKEKETLESIGKDFDICRERVRQIENDSLRKIKGKSKKYKEVFTFFVKYLNDFGGLKKEGFLLNDLDKENQNEVFFILNLHKNIKRKKENKDFHSLWVVDNEIYKKAKKSISILIKKLKEKRELISLSELQNIVPDKEFLKSIIEISKRVQSNEKGLYGLSNWPEINPKGIKDKAYLALKEAGQPLHFAEVAGLIRDSNVQTVHNELIKNNKFVLIGRGIYALSEWGYSPGRVKEVLARTLEEEGPLSKEDLLEKVLEKRRVKKNTILLSLGDKEKFIKNSKGEYNIKSI